MLLQYISTKWEWKNGGLDPGQDSKIMGHCRRRNSKRQFSSFDRDNGIKRES